MKNDVLVTGFTAFGKFGINPAELIARQVATEIDARFEPLEVSYVAATAFVDTLITRPPKIWLMLGVAGKARKVRVERIARNWANKHPDVRQFTPGPRSLSKTHPRTLAGQLWHDDIELPPGVIHSRNAGTYLCNFIYWQAVTRLPKTQAGFIHVVPTERQSADQQVEAVLQIARQVIKPKAGKRRSPAYRRA